MHSTAPLALSRVKIASIAVHVQTNTTAPHPPLSKDGYNVNLTITAFRLVMVGACGSKDDYWGGGHVGSGFRQPNTLATSRRRRVLRGFRRPPAGGQAPTPPRAARGCPAKTTPADIVGQFLFVSLPRKGGV